ncbi:MAG: sensor domain-containing diguanylate cyclase [Candidatus Izemoplasmatales bacterium]
MLKKEEYRLIVESSPNMIWRSNLSTECDYFNRTWLAFTGRSAEEERGFGWASGVHPDDFDRCVKIYLDHFHAHQPFEMDYRLRRHDGEYRWINDRGVPVFDRKGAFVGFIGSCMDVSEKVEGRLLMNMAQNDFLCNTYNRQYAFQLLDELLRQANEHGDALSILMIDVDDFKAINDRFGHAAGDAVLKSVAGTIRDQLGARDVIGRYGGDEFVIGLVGSGFEAAAFVARRIQAAVAGKSLPLSDEGPLHLTVSVGIRTRAEETSLEELVCTADNNLYLAKKEGKNLVRGS